MRKIFLADITDAFAAAAKGTGKSLQYAWDCAAGYKLLEKKGIPFNRNRYGIGPLVAIGAVAGVTIGAIAAMYIDDKYFYTTQAELGWKAFFEIVGSCAALPLAGGQAASLYQASAHKRALYLEERASKALPAPKADVKLS
jgi:hypothetical protein